MFAFKSHSDSTFLQNSKFCINYYYISSNTYIASRRALSGSSPNQAIQGAPQLPPRELPAFIPVRHHLLGQLLRHPGDRAGSHGAARHHAAVFGHNV